MAHLPAMRVLLDGAPLVLAHPPHPATAAHGPSLAQALRAGSDAARAQGRVIIEARGDGIPLTDEQLTNPSDSSHATAHAFRELALTSADPRALVKVTLDDAATAVRDLIREQQTAAADIHSGREQQSLSQLQSIFQTWQMVRDIVDRAQALLEHNLDEVPSTGHIASIPGGATTQQDTVTQASRRLLVQLKQIRTTLASQDWSALADVLEYDMCTEATRWVALLTHLADHVGTLPEMSKVPAPAPAAHAAHQSMPGGQRA